MYNPGYVFLLAIVLVLVGAVILYLVAHTHVQGQNSQPNPPACNASTSNLYDVSTNPCCVVNGQTTDFRVIPSISGVSQLVVASSPTTPIDACAGYCPNGYDANTGGCINFSSTDLDNCLALATPTNCAGLELAVAADGPTLFYPNAANVGATPLCTTFTTCPPP